MRHQTFTRLHSLLDQHVPRLADRVAVVDHNGTVISYSALAELSRDMAEKLRHHGVVAGDRVMLVAENCAAYVAFAFACWRCDAWFTPVNARMSTGEIDRLIDHARPRVVAFMSNVSQPAGDHGQRLGALPMECGVAGTVGILDTGFVEPEPVFDEPDRQIAALMYTTGTTGNPKGVMLSHANLLFASAQSQKIRALSERDVLYCVLPMTHIFGFSSAFLGAMQAATEIRIAARFDPAEVFRQLANGVSVLPAVPAMYSHLLNHAQKAELAVTDWPYLRYMSAGGAPLDPEWKRRVEAFFGCSLHNGYGMTEASPGIASTAVGAERGDISCGKPMSGVEVLVVPAPGQDALIDGVGEIILRGANVMKGYYKNPEETARVIDADGFLHTGDLGHFGEDGCLFLDGRSKELIIRSGFNVYPPEVESALNRHPSVTQTSVVGRTVEGGNEEVLAFVQKVPDSDVSEEELRLYVSGDLAPYKRPSRIVLCDELPASSTGKILKHLLIQTFADRL